MKSLYKIASLLLVFTFVSSMMMASEIEETKTIKEEQLQLNVINKIDEALSCDKIQKVKSKIFNKLKKSISKKKQAKMIEKLSKSQLSPAQQTALLEVVEMYKNEVNVIPEEGVDNSK